MNPPLELITPYYSTPVFMLIFAIVAVLFFLAGVARERRRERRRNRWLIKPRRTHSIHRA